MSSHRRSFPAPSFHPGSDPLTDPSSGDESDPNAIPWFFEFVSCSICSVGYSRAILDDGMWTFSLRQSHSRVLDQRFSIVSPSKVYVTCFLDLPKVCTLCGTKPITTTALAGKLEAELRPWFKNPTSDLKKTMRTVGFQTTEMARVIRELRKQVAVQNTALETANRRVQGERRLRQELEASKQEVEALRAEVESLRRGRPSQGAGASTGTLPLRPSRPAVRAPVAQVDNDTGGFGEPRTFAQGNGSKDGQQLDGFGRPMAIGRDDSRKRQRQETIQQSGPHSEGSLHTPFIQHNPNPRGPVPPERYSLHTRSSGLSDSGLGNKLVTRTESRQRMREHLTQAVQNHSSHADSR
ncbi:hypothetical protein FFLO_02377 [Filobasidium floriforme]|uniref:Uncharacterized protein n=1 Tax=Filobasidium floriforme TaxID=5210 RepID=A0A8K0JNE7_9TREE|nr:hypothetical protein FFLO_02377 [Filobasidium floriforme]